MYEYVDSRGMLAYENRTALDSSQMIELPSVPEANSISECNCNSCCVTPIQDPSVTSVHDVQVAWVGTVFTFFIDVMEFFSYLSKI